MHTCVRWHSVSRRGLFILTCVLRLTCVHGCRVDMQEKRSSYAPTIEQPVRYDGVYRIVRAYRKPGNQGKLVCRYVFKRCDNDPAPWSSESARELHVMLSLQVCLRVCLFPPPRPRSHPHTHKVASVIPPPSAPARACVRACVAAPVLQVPGALWGPAS